MAKNPTLNLNNLPKTVPYRYICDSTDRLLVNFERDKLKEVTSKQANAYSLELIQQDRLGYSSSNYFDQENLVTKAMRSSLYGDKVDYSYPKTKLINRDTTPNPSIAKITPKYLINLGNYFIEELKKCDKNIQVNVGLSTRISEETTLNSSGFKNTRISAFMGAYVGWELVSEGDILSFDKSFFWGENTFKKQDFLKDLINKFKLAKKIVPISSGKYTVVFSPEVVACLFDFLETAMSADVVFRKVSKWGESLNTPVADKRFNLTDDPTIKFAPGTVGYDDEGFTAIPLPLIEGGVLKNFYTDLKNASRLKMAPNGRGFGIPAAPSLTNMVVKSGDKSFSEVIKQIDKGVLIDQVIGAGQDSPYAGDFSFNVHLGFLIEKGEIMGRVKNVMVSGNIFQMLKDQLFEIDSEKTWVGSLFSPHISFSDMTIQGK